MALLDFLKKSYQNVAQDLNSAINRGKVNLTGTNNNQVRENSQFVRQQLNNNFVRPVMNAPRQNFQQVNRNIVQPMQRNINRPINLRQTPGNQNVSFKPVTSFVKPIIIDPAIRIKDIGQGAANTIPAAVAGAYHDTAALGNLLIGNKQAAINQSQKSDFIRQNLAKNNQFYQGFVKPVNEDIQGKNFTTKNVVKGLGKVAGNTGQLVLDMSTYGLPIGAGEKAIAGRGIKSAITSGAKSGALFGAAQEGVNQLREGQFKPIDIAKGAGVGAVFGGGLSLAGAGLGKVMEANGGRIPAGLSIQYTPDGKKYIKVDTDQHLFDNAKLKDYPSIVRKYLNENFVGKTLTSDNGGNITFTKLGSGKYSHSGKNMSPSTFDAKARLTPELGNAAKIARTVGSAKDNKAHGNMAKDGFEYRNFIFDVNGKQYVGTMNLGKNGEVLNFYDVFPIKKTPGTGISGRTTGPETNKPDVSNGIIPQDIKNVNPKSIQQGSKQPGSLNKKGQFLQKPTNQFSATTSSSSDIIPQIEKTFKGNAVKERGFITSVKTSEKTPKQLTSIVNGSYVVKSNKQLRQDAKNLIRTDIKTAEQLAFNPRNDVDVQIGNELINHYSSVGQFDKARAITEGMANSGTEFGRAVQAFSNYDKTTPEGALRFAQQTVNKYNNNLRPGQAKLEITNEQVKNLFDKARQVQAMAEGRERNIASNELMNEVSRLIPSTIQDKAIAVWKAGLLTSPRTTLRNLVGNTLHQGTEIIKDPFAAVNDALLAKRTGQRTLTATTRGLGSGAREGLRNGIDIMKFGYDPTNSIEKFDIKKVNWGENKLEQGLKKYTDFVFNMMGAQDKPFYHAAFARSLYDQAGAAAINAGKRGDKKFIDKLVSSPTTDMLKIATQDASVATFKDRNKLSEIASAFKKKSGAIGEIVAPFTGVPTSIAGQMIQYSPIGLAKGAIKDVKVLAKNVPELQRQASQEIARGIVGTGIMGIAAYLTANGLMTGQPKDTAEARQWQLEGRQANSVFINGQWRSINSIGPEMLVALAGSKLQGSKDTQQAISNVGKDFLSQTFLQGVQGPLNALTDPARYAQQYFQGTAGSLIPNVVKDAAKSVDNTQREINSTTDALKAGTPVLRNTLLPKRDALGQPLPQEPTGLGAFVDLFNSKTPVNDPIVNELSRLNIEGANATPSAPQKTQTINSQKVKINPRQMDKFEQRIGEIARPKLNDLISSAEYQSKTDEARAKAIDKVMQDAREQAKIDVLGQAPKPPKQAKKKTVKPKVAKAKKTKTVKAKKAKGRKVTYKKIAIRSTTKTVTLKKPTLKVASLKVKGGTSGKRTVKLATKRGNPNKSLYS